MASSLPRGCPGRRLGAVLGQLCGPAGGGASPHWPAGEHARHATAAQHAAAVGPPAHVGGDVQLFFDDDCIVSAAGLTRRWHQPEKRGCVLAPEPPAVLGGVGWSAGLIICFGSTLFDKEEGVYKMWYGLHAGVSEEEEVFNAAGAAGGDGRAPVRHTLTRSRISSSHSFPQESHSVMTAKYDRAD
jgi:hypothetical protein